MRYALLMVVACGSFAVAEPNSEISISGFEVKDSVRWGSLSAQQASAGFYGQYFAFDRPVSLKSISVFIYDHPDHVETEASINFGVWSFDQVPTNEIYISAPATIATSEVGNWKTFQIPAELNLEAGEYAIGAGQTHFQGFVAFGNARAVSQDGLWLTRSYSGAADGTGGWRQVQSAPPSVECPTASDCALMVRLNVTDIR